MNARRRLLWAVAPVVLVTAGLVAAITWGGPRPLAPMGSIGAPFRDMDFSGLPPQRTYPGVDRASLAYRVYPVAEVSDKGSVVLIHGASASGASMHFLAQALSQAGYVTYTLDKRGHGASGTRGLIGYVGQLEDDLAAFMQAVAPPQPVTLAGFSAGGGFALRFAGSKRQALFQSYLLLSPFISEDAANHRVQAGGWVSVGLPRIAGLSLLNALGVQAWNHLPVTRFALDPKAHDLLTPAYAFDLAMNFRPLRDYRANIRAVRQPLAVVAGLADEAFDTRALEDIFRQAGRSAPVTLLRDVNHVGLVLEARALETVLATVEGLRSAR